MTQSDKSVSDAEHDLLAALSRLINGAPTHPELVQLFKCRKLRINPSSVAKEANRSRTLISHKNCAYPEVRSKIIKLGQDKRKGGICHSRPQIQDLQHKIAELQSKLELSREENVALIRRLERVELEAQRSIEAIKRKQNRFNVIDCKKLDKI